MIVIMSRTRRQARLSSLIAKPLLSAIAVLTVVVSGQAVAHIYAAANLVDLAVSIENGAPQDAEYLSHFVAAPQFLTAKSDCDELAGRAKLTVALAADEALLAGKPKAAQQASALAAASDRLSCVPLDGNAWAQLADLKLRNEGPTPAVIEELKVSALTAPNEATAVEARLNLVIPLIVAGVEGLDTEFSADLRLFVEFNGPDRIAAAYVDLASPLRARLRPLIDAQSQARKKAIVGEIDRLGQDYGKP